MGEWNDMFDEVCAAKDYPRAVTDLERANAEIERLRAELAAKAEPPRPAAIVTEHLSPTKSAVVIDAYEDHADVPEQDRECASDVVGWIWHPKKSTEGGA